MPQPLLLTAGVARQPVRSLLGERVRHLRVNRGMTQTDLAGERFSKEYVSQIERGKTRPTRETIAWLAARLGVDEKFIETGISTDAVERTAGLVSRAEAAVESKEYADATTILSNLDRADLQAAPDLELRALLAEAWARLYQGEVRRAVSILERARVLAEGPGFGDVDRADVLFRLGCCRVKLASFATANALLTEALALAERSSLPCDRLRSRILEWRARCHQSQRDWAAAREDVERALELAEGLNDRETIAHVYFQASIVAEREGRWVLARSYAERAKAIYEEIADRVNAGRLLNNLGGLNFLLGKPDEALAQLKDAFRVFIESGSDVEAGYAVSSIAQVQLRTGNPSLAEEHARHALRLLADREEETEEIGNARLVLGRSLLEQGRLDEAEAAFALAEGSFAPLSSASHTAAAWIAQGDLAARRGEVERAADFYRNAAEALQDFRF
ncbi:MAG: helix-turn-helix transcriptional regulator [Thermoleophilia bacterium]|nr:helix-turn-helix transcriptional regulator [Thermoleophilia bacterium]MDQ3858730.1 helix-turn-helix transcriptional regulator [Actinomycetota bacterium]